MTTETTSTELLAELVKTRRKLHQREGVPSFSAAEAEVPALMTQYALEASGVVIVATDTGREWTLLGSRGWVLTYAPPQVPDAVTAALADLDMVKTADLAFLRTSARHYGAGSTPAANLAELIALRELAHAVRGVTA